MTRRIASSSGLAVLAAQRVQLLQADAVLAGQRAAVREHHHEQLVAGRERALERSGLARVVVQPRVEVAVAEMRHGREHEVVALGDVGGCAQRRDEPVARRGEVVGVRIRVHAAEGAIGGSARVPGDLDLLVAARLARAATGLLDALDDDRDRTVDALVERLDLDQQRRLDVHGQDAGRQVVERAQHRIVDELAGHQPGRLQHHALGARARLLEPLEARDHDGQALGQRAAAARARR